MELERALKKLGISNLKEILDEKKLKQYYRNAVMKHHPDKGGSEKMFQEVQVAYESIIGGKVSSHTTPNTTKQKDKVRKHRRKRPLDPRDIELKVLADSEELSKGFEYEARYSRRRICHHCEGEGSCPLCNESRVLIEDVVVQAYVHQDLMNKEDEIIYEGHGDQMHQKGDLIIKVLTTY